jgi:hypothetical protein
LNNSCDFIGPILTDQNTLTLAQIPATGDNTDGMPTDCSWLLEDSGSASSSSSIQYGMIFVKKGHLEIFWYSKIFQKNKIYSKNLKKLIFMISNKLNHRLLSLNFIVIFFFFLTMN